MSTYLLVDAANLFHRCKHTTSGDASTKAGMALHISFNALRAAHRRFNVDHIVFCLEGKSWRKSVYPKYKANRTTLKALQTKREQEDDQLYFDAMQEFTDFLDKRTNVTVLQAQGCEADDFVARWVDLHPDDQHVILSGDSDFYQLLSDNVKMYDGVKGWTISTKEVLDEDGNPASTKRQQPKRDSMGKVMKNGKGEPLKESVKIMIDPPEPEFELFKKIIRGDSSDNIMSAYPGAREKGSAKNPGMREAFNDRHGRGFDWNLFMLQEWDKVVEDDDPELVSTEKVRVLDEYNRNRELIDLRCQPQEIKDILDTVILESVQVPPKPGVGVWFLKFCEEMALVNIAKWPTEYANLLAAPYKKL
jgi:5'-3' exonuclease